MRAAHIATRSFTTGLPLDRLASTQRTSTKHELPQGACQIEPAGYREPARNQAIATGCQSRLCQVGTSDGLVSRDAASGSVLIASIKSKMHAISPDVAEGLARGVALAEQQYQGMVIWSGDEPFSVGADLQAMLPAFMIAGVSAIDGAEAELQNLMLRIRYAGVPVVSAVRGMALGGGCELALHSARPVVAMESYIGLVEVGVGLIPGAGGLTYIARRAAENMAASTGKDVLPFLTEGFTAAAMAKVGTSALESRKLGYLLDSDLVVPNKDELLYVALNEARALYQGGWRAPHKRLFPVAGRNGLATIKGSKPQTANIPVIVATAKELTVEEKMRLQGQIQSLMMKGDFLNDEFLNEVRALIK